jgi:hypothetical protein
MGSHGGVVSGLQRIGWPQAAPYAVFLETSANWALNLPRTISNGICSHVPAYSSLSADTFQPWAREVRHKDLNALDFDSLCAETFNEEQSIKRNEAYSNINHGSALKAGNGKEKEASGDYFWPAPL